MSKTKIGLTYPTNATLTHENLPAGFQAFVEGYIKDHSGDAPAIAKLISEIMNDFEAGEMFGSPDVKPTRETAAALRLLADALDAGWTELFRG